MFSKRFAGGRVNRFSIAAMAGMFGVIAPSVASAAATNQPTTAPSTQLSAATRPAGADAALAPDQLFAAASPAVVMVQVCDDAMAPRGQGSGFFVSADGYVVTNFHVVAGAAFA